MTLNQGQGHTNQYQNVKLSSIYHQTKFEQHQFINIWMRANIKFLLTQSVNQQSFPLILKKKKKKKKPSLESTIRMFTVNCFNTTSNFIPTSRKVCEKMKVIKNGVWTHVNSKGKTPSTGKCPQRRIEPATLWTASPSTTNWAIPAPLQWYKMVEVNGAYITSMAGMKKIWLTMYISFCHTRWMAASLASRPTWLIIKIHTSLIIHIDQT